MKRTMKYLGLKDEVLIESARYSYEMAQNINEN